MTRRPSNTLERAARLAWLANASHIKFGRCDSCGRVRDDDGRLLLVAKQERGRKLQCLACFDGRPTGAQVQEVSR